MQKKSIIILGGYGATGSKLAQFLAQETDVSLTIAGRNENRAKAFTAQLRAQFPTKVVASTTADVTEEPALRRAFAHHTMVIDATNTPSPLVASIALELGLDYLDLHFNPATYASLKPLTPAIQKAGRLFITQAGFHPGLPAVFIRSAAQQFDIYQSAFVGMAMNHPVEDPKSIRELIDFIEDYTSEIYSNHTWQPATYKDTKTFNLGPNFGTQPCYPIMLEEMRSLPTQYNLQEAGVYVAGFNWFVDYLVFPLATLCFSIKKGFGRNMCAYLMTWGMRTFSKSQHGVVFVLDAQGTQNSSHKTIHLKAQHPDAYAFTAIPVVACLKQYLNGRFNKPGLWMMGQLVEPNELIEDMQRMGITFMQNEIKEQTES